MYVSLVTLVKRERERESREARDVHAKVIQRERGRGEVMWFLLTDCGRGRMKSMGVSFTFHLVEGESCEVPLHSGTTSLEMFFSIRFHFYNLLELMKRDKDR